MNVREIMASVVQKVNPEDSLYKAARIMKEYDIGCVLVQNSISFIGHRHTGQFAIIFEGQSR